MKTPVKIHGVKYILIMLFFFVEALSSAHACSPEIDDAVAQLQKSARAKTSMDTWLVQIVDETSSLGSAGGEFKKLTETEIIQKLRSVFLDKRSLIYFRKYLADVKICHDTEEWSAPREFRFNKKSYTYTYTYHTPPVSRNGPASVRQLKIRLIVSYLVDDMIGEGKTFYWYCFDIVNGKMKLIRTSAAG